MTLVSIVMPAYNAGKFISEALDSLINQTYKEWECVIVDDGSTDDTLQIITEYSLKDNRIRFKSIPNSGAAKYPRDLAIAESHGDWVVFLDADDILANDALEKLVSRQKLTDADIVLLRMELTDINLHPLNLRIPNDDFNLSITLQGKEAFLYTINGWRIGFGGALISRTLLFKREDVGNLMCADEYDTRFMLLNAQKVAFADALYFYRKTKVSITESFSPKLFDTIKVNILLCKLIESTFGIESKEYKAVISQFVDDLIAKYILLIENKGNLDAVAYNDLLNLIENAYKEAKRKSLAFKKPIKKYIYSSSFALFTYYVNKRVKKRQSFNKSR